MMVRRFVLALGVAALAWSQQAAPAKAAAADCGTAPVCVWNELALKTARVAVLNDARSARLLAMVNVAMYDAVNGLVSRQGSDGRGVALVAETGVVPQGNQEHAAAAAAHTVLAGEFPAYAAGFPDATTGYDAQLEQDLSGAAVHSAGALWGASVGAMVRQLRTGDSVAITQAALPSPAPPGLFQPAWSGLDLRPFGVLAPEIYVGTGPAAFEGLDYAAAYAQVKVLGDAAKPDAEKLATFRFWSLGNGTSQPPGAWVQMALIVLGGAEMPMAEQTRMMTLLTMALADTVGPTTITKAYYRRWRPAAAINGGDLDPNPYTDGEAGWVQRGVPSGSPEYWSGHSAFGGAGAAALAGFFCNDDIPIAGFQSDSAAAAGIPPRDYPGFWAAGNEMGVSRILGGLHFAFSNQQGIAAGRAIANEILATKLLRTTGPTHFGACPR